MLAELLAMQERYEDSLDYRNDLIPQTKIPLSYSEHQARPHQLIKRECH